MLRITNDQLRALRDRQFTDFRQRLEKHLQQHFRGHALLLSGHWQQTCRLLIQRCGTYQLRTESAITIFFNATFCLGLNFEMNACHGRLWNTLADRNLAEGEKIRSLKEHVEQLLQAA